MITHMQTNNRFYVFPNSAVQCEGETFYTARFQNEEYILALGATSQKQKRADHLKGAVSTLNTPGGEEWELKACPATYENLLSFENKVATQRKLRVLTREGYRHGLGTGNRIIISGDHIDNLRDCSALGVFPGIYEATVARDIPNWFIQQSIVRELIPREVDPNLYPDLGHTGGYGPAELLRSGLFAYFSLGGYAAAGGIIGADADHAIVTGGSEAEMEESLQLNKTALKEARHFTKFTVDTCNLFDFPVSLDSRQEEGVRRLFAETFKVKNPVPGMPHFEFKFEEKEALELARKYWKAVEVHAHLYEYISACRNEEEFDYELSLDETSHPTPPRELLFYLILLTEWYDLPSGAVTSVAPSLGFAKRCDYTGNLSELKELANTFAAIAASFNAVLCVHSGSGKGVEFGKGPGVDEALAEACGGEVQLKVSGIYQEIMWRMLYRSPRREERDLFAAAWDRTREMVLNTPSLLSRCEDLEGLNYPQRNPEQSFFRHFAYLVWKEFRPHIYGVLTPRSWDKYARQVAEYTSMRTDALGFSSPPE